MGKLQQLRAKALSLRGALAIGGTVVVAASMTQVAGTLAAPDAVRTAKVGISTANYFPTPLATNIRCSLGGTAGLRKAVVSWDPPVVPVGEPSVNYKYLVTWSLDAVSPEYSFETSNTTTGEFRISDKLGYSFYSGESFRIFVQTINPNTSGVVSSGSVSWTVHSASLANTYCSGESGFKKDNATWENTQAWSPGAFTYAMKPGESTFTTLMDALNSDEVLEPMPEGSELTELPEEAPEPTPTDDANPDAPEASPTATSSSAPGNEAAPEPETDTSTSQKTSSSTRPTTSTPRSTATSTKASTSKAPPTSRTTTRTSAPAASTPPAGTTTTTATTQRAGVGDDPIEVGTAFARLDEVDGQPQLVVSTTGGTQVCTADLPGATRIASTAGRLTVTVDGRTRTVDAATCAID